MNDIYIQETEQNNISNKALPPIVPCGRNISSLDEKTHKLN